MKQLAKSLRSNATDAEKLLWKYLRAHRMNDYKFKRQVVIEPYIVDFVCLEAKLIIEADGGQHNEHQEREKDNHRTAFLEQCGYKVVRFWNHQILTETESVLEYIYRELTNPSP